MRFLIHGINFSPELTGIGKYTGEMARWLIARGHDVRVITAPPYYPEWRIGAGYSSWEYRCEDGALNRLPWFGRPKKESQCVVYRCPLWVSTRLSGLKRVLHLASFAASSLPIMLAQVRWAPNVVIVVEPASLCIPQAWLVARLSGAAAWLHVQDFEMDAAFALGLLPGKLRTIVEGLERIVMRGFDRVSTISRHMVDRLRQKGVDPTRCVCFPNWVDTQVIFPKDRSDSFALHLGIPPGKIVVLYSGNLGEKQGLDVLLNAAKTLRGESGIRFVVSGEGAAKERLVNSFSYLENVQWLGLQKSEHLNDLFSIADLHVLPQLADAADLVMPSKLTGMLASGKPVIATAHQGTEIAETLENCGLVVPPGNSDELAEAILTLANDPSRRKQLGAAARERALATMSLEAILREFETELIRCAGGF